MRYKDFAESGIPDNPGPLNDVQAGIVLGRERFIEERTKEIVTDQSSDREPPALRRFFDGDSVEEVVKTVADYYLLSPSDSRKRSKTHPSKRKVAIYLAKILTQGKNSLLGDYSGITSQTVSSVLIPMECNLAESGETRKEMDDIRW
jgi:chromosomal replication initiation ATPase DnaA